MLADVKSSFCLLAKKTAGLLTPKRTTHGASSGQDWRLAWLLKQAMNNPGKGLRALSNAILLQMLLSRSTACMLKSQYKSLWQRSIRIDIQLFNYLVVIFQIKMESKFSRGFKCHLMSSNSIESNWMAGPRPRRRLSGYLSAIELSLSPSLRLKVRISAWCPTKSQRWATQLMTKMKRPLSRRFENSCSPNDRALTLSRPIDE